MLRKFSNLVIKARWIIISFFVIAFGLSFWAMTKVDVNYNLAKYLPDDASTTIAINIMEDEFGLAGQAEIMVKNVNIDEAMEIKTIIAGLDNVERVTFLNNSTYFSDDDGDGIGSALFKIIIIGYDYSENAENLIADLQSEMELRDFHLNGQSVYNLEMKNRLSSEMVVTLSLGVLIFLVILFIGSTSWIEPALYAAVIGTSVLINLGTNILLGETSYIVRSIAAILQMALSMDYAIILMHNYHHEKDSGSEPKQAMAAALAKSLAPISASSLTTMAGLAAIMFMTFRIGLDIGLVLVKGIFISMVTVFLMLPGLTVIFNKPLEKFKHEPIRLIKRKKTKVEKKNLYIKFLNKTKKVLPLILLIVMGTCYVLQTKIVYTFVEGDKRGVKNEVIETFGLSNQIYMITPLATEANGGYDKQREMIEILSRYKNSKGEPILKDVLSYVTTITLDVDARTASTLMNIDYDLITQIFGTYFLEKGMVAQNKINFNDFMSYVVDLAEGRKIIAEGIDVTTLFGAEQVGYVKAFDKLLKNMNTEMTANQFAMFIASMEEYGIPINIAKESATSIIINETARTIKKSGITYNYSIDGVITDQSGVIVGNIRTAEKQFMLKSTMYSYSNGTVMEVNSILSDYIDQIYGMKYFSEHPLEMPRLTLSGFFSYLDSAISGSKPSNLNLGEFLDAQTLSYVSNFAAFISALETSMTAQQLFTTFESLAPLIGMNDISQYRNYLYFLYGSYGFSDPLYRAYKVNLKDFVAFVASLAVSPDAVIDLSGMLSADEISMITSLDSLFKKLALPEGLSASEMFSAIRSLSSAIPSFDLQDAHIRQVYNNYYYDNAPGAILPEMTLGDFVLYAEQAASKPEWSSMISQGMKDQIATLKYFMFEAMNEEMTAADFFAFVSDPRIAGMMNSNISATHINLIYTLYTDFYNDYTANVYEGNISGAIDLTAKKAVFASPVLAYSVGGNYLYEESSEIAATNGTDVLIGGKNYHVNGGSFYLVAGTKNGNDVTINNVNYTISGTNLLNGGGATAGSVNTTNKTISVTGTGGGEYAYSETTGTVYKTPAEATVANNAVTIDGITYYVLNNALYTVTGILIPERTTVLLYAPNAGEYKYNSLGDIYKRDVTTATGMTAGKEGIYDGMQNLIPDTGYQLDAKDKSFRYNGKLYFYLSDNVNAGSFGSGKYENWDISETVETLYISTAKFFAFLAEVGPDFLGISSQYFNLLALLGSETAYYDYKGMTQEINRLTSLVPGGSPITLNESYIHLLYRLYYFTKNDTENYDPVTGTTFQMLPHNLLNGKAATHEIILFAIKMLNDDPSNPEYYDAEIKNDDAITFSDANLLPSLISIYEIYKTASDTQTTYGYSAITSLLNGWAASLGATDGLDEELIRQVYMMYADEYGMSPVSDPADPYKINGTEFIEYLISMVNGTGAISQLVGGMLTGNGLTVSDATDLLNIAIDDVTVYNYKDLGAFLGKYSNIIGSTALTGDVIGDAIKQAYIFYFVDQYIQGGSVPFVSSSVNVSEILSHLKALTTESNAQFSKIITDAVTDQLPLIYRGLNLCMDVTAVKNNDMSYRDITKFINNLLTANGLSAIVDEQQIEMVYTLYAVENNFIPVSASKNSISYTAGNLITYIQSLLNPAATNKNYNAFLADVISQMLVEREAGDTDGEYADKKAAMLENLVFVIDTFNNIYLMSINEEGYTYLQTAEFINNAINVITSPDILALLDKTDMEEMHIDASIIEQVYVRYLISDDKMPDKTVTVEKLIAFVTDILENNPTISGIVSDEQKAMLTNYTGQIEAGIKMFNGKDHSRIIFVLNLEDGGDETFAFIDTIRNIAQIVYGEEDTYLAGNSISLRDICAGFEFDMLITTVISLLSILLVVMLVYRSLLLPFLLVGIIQGAIWISFAFNTLTGTPMFFMAYIIATCIQMGATIDYGIIVSSNYLYYRKSLPKLKALTEALRVSAKPIFTSGAVLTIAGIAISFLSTSVAISSIGGLLARGTIVSIFLVLTVLPQILLLFDKALQKTTYKAKFAPEEEEYTGEPVEYALENTSSVAEHAILTEAVREECPESGTAVTENNSGGITGESGSEE